MKTTLILGSTVIDMIVRVPHLPSTQEDINTRSMTMALGGRAYNVARMSRLFQPPVFHCSPTGDGIFGQITEQLLSAEGLRPSVRVSGQDNGCRLCLVEDGGERTFLSAHGAEYRFDPQWLKDLDPASLDYVYVCGIELEEPTGRRCWIGFARIPVRRFLCARRALKPSGRRLLAGDRRLPADPAS